MIRSPGLLAALLLGTAASACSHTDAVDPIPERTDIGPSGTTLPRQLTFNRGGDADPSVSGDRIVYSRRQIPQADSDWCLAFLPLAGGTLAEPSSCPDDGAENGTKEAWLQPTISPNGEQLAFVVETGGTSEFTLAPTFRKLVVGPATNPAAAEEVLDVTRGLYQIQGPFGLIRANTIHRLQWLDDANLLFITGTQKNLAGQFCCDTLYVPIAAIKVDLETGSWERLNLGPLPPGDVAVGRAGSILYTQAEDPAFDRPFIDCADEAPVCPQNQIWTRAADGTLSLVADLGGLETVDRLFGRGEHIVAMTVSGSMYSLDQGSGATTVLSILVPPIAHTILDLSLNSAGDRAVALVDPAFTPANLWLLPVSN